MGPFTWPHRISSVVAIIQCLETHDLMTSSSKLCLRKCVRVAVAESVRSGSIAVVSGINYNDH